MKDGTFQGKYVLISVVYELSVGRMCLIDHVLCYGAAGLAKEEPHCIRIKLMLHWLRHICINLSLDALKPEHSSALGPLTIAPHSCINSEVVGIKGPI